MEDLIFAPLVLLIGFGIHQVVLRRHELPFERRLLNRSFAAHMAATVGLILVYTFYYPGGDMISYWSFGVPIADALRYDFEEVFPQTLSLFLHGDFRLPLDIVGTDSTGTMQTIAVWLLFIFGNSLYAAALCIGVLSYLAKVLVYRALRDDFEQEKWERVLFACALSPSGVVWTCALLKEPALMVFFGPAFLGLKYVLDGRRLALGAALIGFGSLGIMLLKPYVLIALALGGGAWILWARTLKSGGSIVVKPLYFVVAIAVAMLGLTVVSTFVPSLSPDKVAESMQYQRRVSAMEQGGSNFYLEGPGADAREVPTGGLLSQLALMPIALVTALFRPFIFESFSPLQFLNAIEMTWLTWMFVQVIRRNGWRGLLKRILGRPALMFCTVFVLVLALGTGLSTANLGTLSRYRAPMMPFFLLLLVVLREPEAEAAPAKSPAPLTTARA